MCLLTLLVSSKLQIPNTEKCTDYATLFLLSDKICSDDKMFLALIAVCILRVLLIEH